MDGRKEGNHGFTLIELSIVLVIIGGVLVGQDLIKAAPTGLRASSDAYQEGTEYAKAAGDDEGARETRSGSGWR